MKPTVGQRSGFPQAERRVSPVVGAPPTGRHARYYTITAAGRRQLGNEISSFDAMLVAINRVLRRA